jgi:hypothetical protein
VAYVFFLVFQSVLSFLKNKFEKAIPMQDVANPGTVCRIFLSSDSKSYFIFHTVGSTDILNPSPAPHFNTFKVQSDQVSASNKGMLQM